MSIIERGQSFIQELTELNNSAFSRYFEIQREAVETFVEANRTRFDALREVKGVEDFVNVQRDYFAALQSNVTESWEKQGQLARENMEATNKMVRELFQAEEEEAAVAAAEA